MESLASGDMLQIIFFAVIFGIAVTLIPAARGKPVIDFFDAMDTIWLAENEARIPKDLPVLIASGDKDPAGGMSETTQVLIGRYEALGLHDLTAVFYPDARHEILNEVNRDEVQADILGWMNDRIG